MPLYLDNIVLWSRSFDEYAKFFMLNEQCHKNLKILACADGASSFNLEATELGYDVTSNDPIYHLDLEQINELIGQSCSKIYPLVKENKEDYVWDYFVSPEDLRDRRLETMQKFMGDFAKKGIGTKYIPAALPELPFASDHYDLALVSHFLFLYSEHLPLQFHIDSLNEILRVASEVRVYPLHKNHGGISEHVTPVIDYFEDSGYKVELVEVDYMVAKNSNKMLKITRK